MLKRNYYSTHRFVRGNIKEGETFSIDSNMGGSFTVKLVGWRKERGLWRCINPDWEALSWLLSPEQAAERLFCYSD